MYIEMSHNLVQNGAIDLNRNNTHESKPLQPNG